MTNRLPEKFKMSASKKDLCDKLLAYSGSDNTTNKVLSSDLAGSLIGCPEWYIGDEFYLDLHKGKKGVFVSTYSGSKEVSLMFSSRRVVNLGGSEVEKVLEYLNWRFVLKEGSWFDRQKQKYTVDVVATPNM